MIIINKYGFVPSTFKNTILESPFDFKNYSTIISSLFIHGNLFHFLLNMTYLFIFGIQVEKKIDRLPFLSLYFSSGIISALIHFSFFSNDHSILIGASGAISSLLAAHLLIFNGLEIIKNKNQLNFISKKLIISQLLIIYWLFIQLSSIFSFITSNTLANKGWIVHIGGFVAGFIFIKILKFKKIKNLID